jgi:hypothetical protein
MDYCYLCRKEISYEIRSEEHIIPNAIGGKLKTYSALCKNHNSELGDKLDAEFVKIFSHISKLIPIRFDRPVSDSFQGKHIEHKIDVTISKNKVFPSKFKYIKDESIVYAPNEKIFKNYSKKLKKNGCDLNLIKSVTEISDGSIEIFSGFDNQIFKQGFAKIAVGFASHHEIKAEFLDLALDANGFKDKLCVLANFPDINDILKIPEENNDYYPFHVIALHSDKSGFLYCYIELFSKFKHYVLLSSNFKGDIHKFYIYSFSKNEEINISDYINLYSNYKRALPLENNYKYRDIQEYIKELYDERNSDTLKHLSYLDSLKSNKYIEKFLVNQKIESKFKQK